MNRDTHTAVTDHELLDSLFIEFGHPVAGPDSTGEQLADYVRPNVPHNRTFGFSFVRPLTIDLTATCTSHDVRHLRINTWKSDEFSIVGCDFTVTGADESAEMARRVQKDFCSRPVGALVPRSSA